MIKESNKRTVIVGVFIFVGLIIFTVGILFLGGQRKAFVSSIRVKAMFHDINGLAAGNNVWYSGVKVGTVKKITFVQHNVIEVIMNIEKSSRQFIHKDVKAKVGSDGLVGNKIVVLFGGTETTPAVENGDVIVAEAALSPDNIMATLQVNNENLVEITGNLKTITKNIADGQGTIGKLLKDDSAYTNIQATLNNLKTTAANTQRLTDRLADYASKLQSKGSLTNNLITDTVVFSRLRSTVTEMEEAAQKANGMVADLKKASASVSENLTSDQSPAGVLLHDQESAAALKKIITNLESSSSKLDQNMEALKHNFLLRGYFRKQAKREKKEQAAKEKALNEVQGQ
ncbi:MCE family protein [Chitinophaga oryzae]|uniref:MCE family protein n=1 Tax=Chitinophaga oryzae TaxID=2725414 RepID=A0AAE7D7U1_9BACT|nr:MlaD family protein [Chitinophaga oryzae]QJB31352.1 MCE family protein [Chitinophaga oryzae]QJB37837.1 MCE family protein [Chitinophaga oryzae]